MMRGIFDRVGSFVERTSNWAFSNRSNIAGDRGRIRHSTIHCRPTAVFSYDWRRPLPELCTALHRFCEDTVSDVCIFWGEVRQLMIGKHYTVVLNNSPSSVPQVSESTSADPSAFARRLDDLRCDAQSSGKIFSRRRGCR